MNRGAAGPGRAGVEVLGSGPVRAQARLILRWELSVRVLERVDARLRVRALLECGQPRRAHTAVLDQLRDLLDVHLAPVAAGLPRREALHVAVVIDPVRAGIDPSPAEGLIDRLGPAHRALAGVLLVEAHVDLRLALVVLLEPVVELLW